MKSSPILTFCFILVLCEASFAQQTFFHPTSSPIASPAGKVGIGAGLGTPNANLQIGSGAGDGLLNLGGYAFVGALRSSGDLFAGMNVNASYASSTENSIFRIYGSNVYGFSGMQMGHAGDITFYNKSGPVTAGDQANTTANRRMKIGGSGNVSVYNRLSVGTEFPGGCNCVLAVEGKVAAREVQVLAAGWPDFVFEKDYKLPSLEEVSSFIEQNHHLPNVPSAAQVEKEGMELGKMNAVLLQKIEELTLYLLESKKENQEFRQRIEALEKSK